MDDEACYAAVRSKDARFDGMFYSGVSSTGIYCRPSCPAMTPQRENLTFHRTAAAAQTAGFRACKRCRPDAVPGTPEWNLRADVVSRAMRLVCDGVVDRDGVGGLAARVGYSERHLNRLLVTEVGASALALARAQRATTARMLLESTDMSVIDVSLAAGFCSVRQFNETIQQVFALTPTQLRAALRRPRSSGQTTFGDVGFIRIRLPYREPLDAVSLLSFLGHRAVAGTESFDPAGYRRSVALAHGVAVIGLRVGAGAYFECELFLEDLRDLTSAVQRTRRMLDLDCDPLAIDNDLAQDPLLAPLVRAHPGRRLPGTLDPHELAIRVVIGQQVSVASARTIAARLITHCGDVLSNPVGEVSHTFPSAGVLAELDPEHLRMPVGRKRAITALSAALAAGTIDLGVGADWDESCRQLLAIPGIGPWTVAAIRMRALGDPDVMLSTDLGVRHAVKRLGVAANPAAIEAAAALWKPWRSYATGHLWSSLEPAIAPAAPDATDAGEAKT